jgi:hypothetical protein
MMAGLGLAQKCAYSNSCVSYAFTQHHPFIRSQCLAFVPSGFHHATPPTRPQSEIARSASGEQLELLTQSILHRESPPPHDSLHPNPHDPHKTAMAKNGKASNGPAFPQAQDSTSISYQNAQEEDTPLVVGMGATHAQHETSGSSSSALEMEFDGGRSWCWRAGERGGPWRGGWLY